MGLLYRGQAPFSSRHQKEQAPDPSLVLLTIRTIHVQRTSNSTFRGGANESREGLQEPENAGFLSTAEVPGEGGGGGVFLILPLSESFEADPGFPALWAQLRPSLPVASGVA